MLVNGLIKNSQRAAPTRPPAYTYRETMAAAHRVAWRIEDIIGGGKTLDFANPFLPESLARTEELYFLGEGEKRVLNQIRGHAYLCLFGLVEEFILPFVLDHVRTSLGSGTAAAEEDDYRVRAFLQFAGEEAKHIQLFKLFHQEFRRGFPTECAVIGPPAKIAKAVLSHQPLAVALLILHIEWMTQRHYIESIREDGRLDPQFKSLLRNHWLEEAQHAKLDAMMIETLAQEMSAGAVEQAVNEYLEIAGFLDAGLKQQTLFDLEALERATARVLSGRERQEFTRRQHQANRWTYLGTGMTHPNFLATLGRLSYDAKKRVEQAAPAFF